MAREVRTPGVSIPGQQGILEECRGCGGKGRPNAGGGLCPKCLSREYRKDPEKRRRENEANRKRRRAHPRPDRRPHSSKRKPTDRVPQESHVYPEVNAYCAFCRIQLLDPEPLCGFCLVELPPTDKLRIMEQFPERREDWTDLFSLLTNHELDEMYNELVHERARRLANHVRDTVLPRNTRLYGPPPAHHAKCERCGRYQHQCECEVARVTA